MAKAPPTWETFRDRSYYDMWAVRMVGERTFGQGIHVMTQAEAEGLCDLLNTTSQVDALRAEIERLRVYVEKAEGVFRSYELHHQRSAAEITTLGHHPEREVRLNKAERNRQMADEACAALSEPIISDAPPA